jgi:hypothetical protein
VKGKVTLSGRKNIAADRGFDYLSAGKAYGKSRGTLQRQIKAFGNTPTPEICQAIDNKTVKWPRLPMSEETRRKISQSQIGKIISIETRKKQSISAKKRPPISEETRQKLSKASKGRKMSKESIEKRVTKMKEHK